MCPSHLEREPDDGFVHIASSVVQADAKCLPALSEALTTIDGVEVHASDPCGKLIVTVESACADGISNVLDRIRELRGFFSANLVYHQVEGSYGSVLH